MKLRGKFNLVLFGVFGLALGASGYLSYQQLNENARNEVLTNAGVLMQGLLSARTWAVTEVGPNLRETEPDEEFLMMGVPPYAAGKVFEGIKNRYPDYTYREVALNPLNRKHLPADWEKIIINKFRADANYAEEWGVRDSPKGPILYIARPIQIIKPGCLGCHTSPEKSPAALVRIYGTENGYGWKKNEIVGAQIVTVPMSVPLGNAEKSFRTFMYTLGGVFVALFVLINMMLSALIVRPLARMAVAADEISKGNFKVEEFSEEGNDEVTQLSVSFNRMKRSLEKAMALFYANPEQK
jgi:protein-histidine pros-kinase